MLADLEDKKTLYIFSNVGPKDLKGKYIQISLQLGLNEFSRCVILISNLIKT